MTADSRALSSNTEKLPELRERLDAYLEKHLADFQEQDAISLAVLYRVSPQFIAAVRSQRLELASLQSENERLKETALTEKEADFALTDMRIAQDVAGSPVIPKMASIAISLEAKLRRLISEGAR